MEKKKTSRWKYQYFSKVGVVVERIGLCQVNILEYSNTQSKITIFYNAIRRKSYFFLIKTSQNMFQTNDCSGDSKHFKSLNHANKRYVDLLNVK